MENKIIISFNKEAMEKVNKDYDELKKIADLFFETFTTITKKGTKINILGEYIPNKKAQEVVCLSVAKFIKSKYLK